MATAPGVSSGLPVKEISGSYGLPFVRVVVDQFDYFVIEGAENFFKTLIKKYKSTVLRVNMPPGSPIVSDSTVIILMDAKSFPTLFDLTKVDKANVLTGAYMPSTDFTGGYRMAVYQVPSEDTHGKLKAFCFHVLNMARPRIFLEFARVFDELCVEVEKTLEKYGKASFSDKVDGLIFNFLCQALIGADLVAPGPASLGTSGPMHVYKTWLMPQLSPIVSSGILPKVLDEIIIHTIPLPFSLISQDSKKLYDFIYTRGSSLLNFAIEELGLLRDEACHDLLFNLGFNAFRGMLIFSPSIIKYVAKGGEDLHREIVKQVHRAVEGNEGLNMKVLESMALVRSVVYEALRMDLPMALQYGRAKRDFMVESYNAAYEVKKGELLDGYQPLAPKDPRVFANVEDFVAGRFMGEEGEKHSCQKRDGRLPFHVSTAETGFRHETAVSSKATLVKFKQIMFLS